MTYSKLIEVYGDTDTDFSEHSDGVQALALLMKAVLPLCLLYVNCNEPRRNTDVLDAITSVALTLSISMLKNNFDADDIAPAMAQFQRRFADGMTKVSM